MRHLQNEALSEVNLNKIDLFIRDQLLNMFPSFDYDDKRPDLRAILMEAKTLMR